MVNSSTRCGARAVFGACVGVVLLGSVGGGADLIPQGGRIKTDRPRLLLRPRTTPYAVSLDQLSAIPRDDDFNTMLARLKGWKSAMAQAMVYRLTGDESAAERAIEKMRHFKASEKSGPFEVYFGLRNLALAYDWLHTYKGFTNEMKAEVRRKAAPLAAAGMRISNDHVFHNYIWMSAGGTALWALATAGDDPQADQLLEAIRERLNDRLYPAMAYLGGAPGESMWYWALYDLSPAALSVLAAQSAYETDLVGAIKKKHGDWLGRHFLHLLHCTGPAMRYLTFGDTKTGPDGGVTHEMAGVLDGLTWAFNSREGVFFSRWLAKKRGPKRFYGETAVFYFLYTRHLTAKPATPALAYFAGGTHGGHVLARSGWDEGATIVGFRCTDHYGAHNHYDQGSFIISRNGPLAIDAPVYKRVRGPQQRTEYHNTLLIGGQGQRAVHGQSFKTLDEFKENLSAGARLETGDILFYKDTPAWTAVSGQFAQAYAPDQVASCVRQLLFIRPGTVVIIDRLVAPPGKPLPEVQWLLQVPKRPSVDGGGAAVSNGTSWLRCMSLPDWRFTPTVEGSIGDTYRAVFKYSGGKATTMCHLLQVGDGTPPTGRPQVRMWTNAQQQGITVGGRRFLFEDRPPFKVGIATAQDRP